MLASASSFKVVKQVTPTYTSFLNVGTKPAFCTTETLLSKVCQAPQGCTCLHSQSQILLFSFYLNRISHCSSDWPRARVSIPPLSLKDCFSLIYLKFLKKTRFLFFFQMYLCTCNSPVCRS